ncbi:hypothetical protein GCM10022233_38470 [Streptomyces shaanxiensis]|uniref:ABC transporter substrate-binding protein n=1 Tax=Streptomyces shaanxiensis TaxID=653357 RepID=A0ABP7V7L4_9ACTN
MAAASVTYTATSTLPRSTASTSRAERSIRNRTRQPGRTSWTAAVAYVRDGHLDGFAKITADATHQPLAQAKKDLVDAQAQRPTQARTVGDDTIASQQKVADVFTELGALKEHLDVKSFWTTDLNADLKKAL